MRIYRRVVEDDPACSEENITKSTNHTEPAPPQNLNFTFYCKLHNCYKAFLLCPVCQQYTKKCRQLSPEDRRTLETSPFFEIAALAWDRPRRIQKMYIGRRSDGTLEELTGFDPQSADLNAEEYRDVEEVLVVTKTLRRKVTWAPVSAAKRKKLLAATDDVEGEVSPEPVTNKTRKKRGKNV